MRLETVKTFVLIVLIGISMLLSYTLWSYQPNSNRTIGGEIVDKETDVGGLSDKTKRSMVKPGEIIFHKQDRYYGFINAVERDQLYEEMQKWVITDFEAQTSDEDFQKPNNGVELIFPDEIPMDIMNSLFKFGFDDFILPTWSIDRIFISFLTESKSLQLDFISSENNQTSHAVINDTKSYEKLWSMMANINEEKLQRYLVINEDTSPIYIPQDPVSLPNYSITATDINPGRFVNILFANPTIVRETNSESIGEAYFTDSRQLSVYSERMRMEYVNHATSNANEDVFITEVELLDRTIRNINSHSGWTGDYRLEDIHSPLHRISFQMYYRGYPVFSNYKLSTIQQRWGVSQTGDMQLLNYDRPLFSFDREVLLREVDDLSSGENVIAYLENHTDVAFENIQDIKVGYELIYKRDDQESEYIELNPMWYKKENGIWQKIVFDEDTNPKGVE